LEKFYNNNKIKKLILAITLIICLGILLFFKYFNFFYEIYCDLAKLFSGSSPSGYFVIMLPAGISFYTFQTASYVIDIYKGKVAAERHFGYYALFVSFFPQLVAGPIERPQDLLPQLKSSKSIKKDVDFSSAFRIMLIGFFKKIAVADIIGIYVNNIYNNLAEANGLSILIATILFTFQIYCDFSGYSDIAVGCAKLFGVNLTENFKTPYKSKSIKEFWNRWHISLSKWLRDYIYFPLGGSRVNKFRWAINILVVFFISGLWHGASYTYVVWGLIHAIFQIIGALTLKYRNAVWDKIHVDSEGKLVSCLRICGTFLLVMFAWIFFRANSISDAFFAIGKIFSDYSFNDKYFMIVKNGFGLVFLIYTLLSVPFMLNLESLKSLKSGGGYNIYKYSVARYVSYIIMTWCIICAWIYLQSSDIASSFIYFQF
jgi:D-alanyl-lipoteichoic acid acyltransferase DltB (MBOAT superfamily)